MTMKLASRCRFLASQASSEALLWKHERDRHQSLVRAAMQLGYTARVVDRIPTDVTASIIAASVDLLVDTMTTRAHRALEATERS